MAWGQLSSKTPTSIGAISLTFTDRDDVPANHIATYVIEILDQNENQFGVETGDLEPHLTGAEKTAFVNFLAGIRDKAEAAFLPD